MRILVLGGNENAAVACVRSLGRAGHHISVGSHYSWSKAGWSRYARGKFSYPSPRDNGYEFVKCIAEEASLEPGTLVLPVNEITTLPVSEHREVIYAAGGRLVLPDHNTILRAFDKQETTRLAASLGVAIPRTEFMSNREQLIEASQTISYPVVMKPHTSEEVSASGRISETGMHSYARDAKELITAYDIMSARCASVLLQEFVAGSGAGYFALMRHGEVRAEFAHRRIREVRPTGAGSAVRVSVPIDPNIREAGLAILRALKWHGAAMVEFRVRQDGTPLFLEVNGRFWNSLPLAVYAGADFPSLVAEMAVNGDIQQPGPYRSGVRCRWLRGDLKHLLEVWRGDPASYPGEFPSRFRATFDFVVPKRGTFHDCFMIDDPLPELGDWLDLVRRALPARFKRRNTLDSLPSANSRLVSGSHQ